MPPPQHPKFMGVGTGFLGRLYFTILPGLVFVVEDEDEATVLVSAGQSEPDPTGALTETEVCGCPRPMGYRWHDARMLVAAYAC